MGYTYYMFFRKTRRIKELESTLAQKVSELFDMQKELFEAQEFERIAAGKLKTWVEKHDTLLISFKEYKKLHEPNVN